MKELKEVTYHYTDGTSITREPWKTPLETLKKANDEEWSISDLKEFMQKHYSAYDGWVSMAFSYLMDLGYTVDEANEELGKWTNEWELPV